MPVRCGGNQSNFLKAGGAGGVLFLVHDGPGELLPYASLIRNLPVDLAVYGIEPEGTDRCPLILTRITEITAHYAEQIRKTQPAGPYVVGGLGGGLIAFEVALNEDWE